MGSTSAPLRGLVSQAAAPARPGHLRPAPGPGGDPRPGRLRVPAPRQCHCSLTSRLGPAPLPPTLPPPPPAPRARDPAASEAPAAQGSPRSPAGAAPPCALPNLPLLFQLPSSPRLRHGGGLQNVERGVTATPGIRNGLRGLRAEAAPACWGGERV
ncbi:hypothetical protein P7K49_023836, partial [Saguinus oedipus]